MNERCLTAIAITLLMLSLLAPTIALYSQTEEQLNDSKSITNTTMPDLLVKGISVSPPLYQNETARINATIKNNGTDSGKFNVSFLVDGALREEKAIEALKSLAAPKCVVIRDGLQTVINSRELVPGDIVVLNVGDIVPANLRLFQAIKWSNFS